MPQAVACLMVVVHEPYLSLIPGCLTHVCPVPSPTRLRLQPMSIVLCSWFQDGGEGRVGVWLQLQPHYSPPLAQFIPGG